MAAQLFEHLPKLQVMIRHSCQYAVWPAELEYHLKQQHQLPHPTVQGIIQVIQQWEHLAPIHQSIRLPRVLDQPLPIVLSMMNSMRKHWRTLLGIRFTWKDGSIQLDQETYTRQILEEFGMADCKPASSPLSPSIKLDSDSPRLDRQDHKVFRRLIGRMMFLVTGTRPDVTFTVNQLSQYLAEPGKVHLAAAKHVFRYLKGSIDYGLVYGTKGSQKRGLIAYSDSAYANSKENKSTTGFIFMIDDSPICWNSRKQSVTAQSSTEAEYIAASEAAKQAIWCRHFLYAIRKEAICRRAPTIIFKDNQGAIKIADNPVNHPKTKHIAVRYHAIRDHVNNGEIQLEYLPTDQMVADGLTKTTNKISQARLAKGLGLIKTGEDG
ncbi:uncharacterized protein KD926_002992 [Aspergillus affinis]|uniref:uncharacterized protein n=1 Tax=Aspergillus affinis TaxID=1070780 RepID=UPI0022FEEB6E|nr:uncharacterized protein KD926_002992 [Aspergillus affinis]KAI9043642.1 hypothetical protein KD926_002992 [Aspergillus affinis]